MIDPAALPAQFRVALGPGREVTGVRADARGAKIGGSDVPFAHQDPATAQQPPRERAGSRNFPCIGPIGGQIDGAKKLGMVEQMGLRRLPAPDQRMLPAAFEPIGQRQNGRRAPRTAALAKPLPVIAPAQVARETRRGRQYGRTGFQGIR